MIKIGIDPGTHTGIAIFNDTLKKFIEIKTEKIHKAMETVLKYRNDCTVIIEDARLRKWYGNSGREVLQGIGSIKRDCKIWEDFLMDEKIKFLFVKPKKGMTKWNADYFMRMTGWEKGTSEHSRDAACLIFGL